MAPVFKATSAAASHAVTNRAFPPACWQRERARRPCCQRFDDVLVAEMRQKPQAMLEVSCLYDHSLGFAE